MPANATSQAAGVLEALRALPLATHLAIGTGLLAGLMLWAFGRRVMKPAFAVAGLAVGGVTGLLLTPVVGLPAIGPAEPPYVGLGAGAFAGLILAAVLFRVLVAGAAGIVLAVAGTLAAAAWLDARPATPGGQPPTSGAIIGPLGRPADEDPDPRSEGLQPGQSALEHTAQSLADRTRAFVQAAAGRLREVWAGMPGRHRVVLVGGAVLGAAGGVLTGFFLPRKATAVVSAPLGAAIWLPSFAWLAHAIGAPGADRLPASPLRWLVVWLVVSGAGAAIQLASMRRGKKGDD